MAAAETAGLKGRLQCHQKRRCCWEIYCREKRAGLSQVQSLKPLHCYWKWEIARRPRRCRPGRGPGKPEGWCRSFQRGHSDFTHRWKHQGRARGVSRENCHPGLGTGRGRGGIPAPLGTTVSWAGTQAASLRSRTTCEVHSAPGHLQKTKPCGLPDPLLSLSGGGSTNTTPLLFPNIPSPDSITLFQLCELFHFTCHHFRCSVLFHHPISNGTFQILFGYLHGKPTCFQDRERGKKSVRPWCLLGLVSKGHSQETLAG